MSSRSNSRRIQILSQLSGRSSWDQLILSAYTLGLIPFDSKDQALQLITVNATGYQNSLNEATSIDDLEVLADELQIGNLDPTPNDDSVTFDEMVDTIQDYISKWLPNYNENLSWESILNSINAFQIAEVQLPTTRSDFYKYIRQYFPVSR